FKYYNIITGHKLFIEPWGNDRVPHQALTGEFDYVVIDNLGIGTHPSQDELKSLVYLTCSLPNHMDADTINEFSKNFFSNYSLIKEYLCPCSNTKILVYKIIPKKKS
ncbi:MAG: hypothetical protein PHF11_00645, partial [Candidatus Omnitrophica bacterium]|nr:hypothetical protein [Candidatus Omnitrophota bacterium]